MSASKKKPQTTASREAGNGTNTRTSRKDEPGANASSERTVPPGKAPGRGSASAAKEKTFVQQYYPAFENLILFFLGMGTYWEALQTFMEEEFRYRTGQAFLGFAFFLVGGTFLVGSICFLILALFFGLQWLTGSNFGAAFGIFLIALGLAAVFFYLTVVRFSKVVEPRYQDDNEKDEWDDF